MSLKALMADELFIKACLYLANGPTHEEVVYMFASSPCVMITVPFVLSYPNRYWYKNNLQLTNPGPSKLITRIYLHLTKLLLSELLAVCCSTKG